MTSLYAASQTPAFESTASVTRNEILGLLAEDPRSPLAIDAAELGLVEQAIEISKAAMHALHSVILGDAADEIAEPAYLLYAQGSSSLDCL